METKIYTRDSLTSDIGDLIRTGLRDSDYSEAYNLCGYDPYIAVYESWIRSNQLKTVVIDGKAEGIIGTVANTVLARDAAIWFVATDKVEEFPKTFATISRQVVNELASGYNTVYNFVDSDNKISIRWLEWLGFSVDSDPQPLGPFKHLFHRFELRGELCA